MCENSGMKYSLIRLLLLMIVSPAFATDGKDSAKVPAKPTEPVLVFKIVTEKESEEPGTVYESEGGKVFVEKEVLMDSSDVKSAHAALYPKGWVILLDFTREGGLKFAKVTEQSVGKRLAMIADGKLLSAPNIHEPIKGGSCEITGNFTREEASAIAETIEKEIEAARKP